MNQYLQSIECKMIEASFCFGQKGRCVGFAVSPCLE